MLSTRSALQVDLNLFVPVPGGSCASSGRTCVGWLLPIKVSKTAAIISAERHQAGWISLPLSAACKTWSSRLASDSANRQTFLPRETFGEQSPGPSNTTAAGPVAVGYR